MQVENDESVPDNIMNKQATYCRGKSFCISIAITGKFQETSITRLNKWMQLLTVYLVMQGDAISLFSFLGTCFTEILLSLTGTSQAHLLKEWTISLRTPFCTIEKRSYSTRHRNTHSKVLIKYSKPKFENDKCNYGVPSTLISLA